MSGVWDRALTKWATIQLDAEMAGREPHALGQHAVNVAQEISKYGLWVSIAIVVLVVASQMRGARARS